MASLLELYPEADLFLHVGDEGLIRSTVGEKFRGKIKTTFISSMPFAKKYYQKYLPLMPLALEQLDLSGYGLVITSESGPSKGVITDPEAIHICYCHSPMRYIWDMYHSYLNNAGKIIRILFPLIAHWLRIWDFASAARVDFFISNSNFVSQRINKTYKRSSVVIPPPVEVSKFNWDRPRSDFYLCLGQLVGYKRVDLAVEAFNELNLPLIVIGEGEEMSRLTMKAKANIVFLGRQPFEVVKNHLETCRALIFPGTEDFGIVPVEAMAAGAPVIAFKKGGILDTVLDGETGILFEDQTCESLERAVRYFESNKNHFNSHKLHQHAAKFDKSFFLNSISEFIQKIRA